MSKPDLASLEKTIEKAFEERDTISAATRGETRDAIQSALDLLDRGAARVAERQPDGKWHVNQWLKKAVLLSFRLYPMEIIKGGPGQAVWWDKVASKFDGWSAVDFEKAGDLKTLMTDPGQLALYESVTTDGYLDGRYMAATFNALRGKDLIWNYVVNNYLLGEDYPAFDLLYWNGHVTNLPINQPVSDIHAGLRGGDLLRDAPGWSDEMMVGLAFSGGGMRAAAFSFGVL